MDTNPLKERWRVGAGIRPVVPTTNPAMTEHVASTGIDWIAWDMQHGLTSDDDLAGRSGPAGTSVAPVVRVGANDALLIGRALDAGAAGVIVPLVNTAEEAARAVRSCRYPPVGERSFGPNRATLVMGSLDPRVIEDVACIVMVETTQGLANVDAIAATPGIDAILVGPSDLALGLGLDYDDLTEPHRHAVQRILDACTANGSSRGSCWEPATTRGTTRRSGSGS